MISLERTLFTYFENVKNYIRVQPLLLGGVSGSGGGNGGPPGGYLGQLPQLYVCYDTDELATSYTPPSGQSLIDNLNHIRNRLHVLETASGGPGTITVYSGGGYVASGITTLDFLGELNVVASGEIVTIEHPREYSDYLNITVASKNFNTTYIYVPSSIKVYYDGLRQFINIDYVQASGYSGIHFITTVPSGSKVVADYLYYESSQPDWTGWGDYWGGMPWGT